MEKGLWSKEKIGGKFSKKGEFSKKNEKEKGMEEEAF